MRFIPHVFAAAVLVCVSSGNALAQATDAGATNANPNSATVNEPSPLNAGTLAENANTTALTTSSYHQGDGLFSFFSRTHQ